VRSSSSSFSSSGSLSQASYADLAGINRAAEGRSRLTINEARCVSLCRQNLFRPFFSASDHRSRLSRAGSWSRSGRACSIIDLPVRFNSARCESFLFEYARACIHFGKALSLFAKHVFHFIRRLAEYRALIMRAVAIALPSPALRSRTSPSPTRAV